MSMQTILLKQHIGAPCEPVVAAGDQVQRGTLIAKPAGLEPISMQVCPEK